MWISYVTPSPRKCVLLSKEKSNVCIFNAINAYPDNSSTLKYVLQLSMQFAGECMNAKVKLFCNH
jgi:hypothetical protein